MKNRIDILLNATPEQAARLAALQQTFAVVCNSVAKRAQEHRCWNRVTLHHLCYHPTRQAFPELGSQMVCNAVYAVSRTYRMLLSHPSSPWNQNRTDRREMPQLQFQASAPVYFDRHTLSLKKNRLSMYTLDGRMHFELALEADDQALFAGHRLLEITLTRQANGFSLGFIFDIQQPAQLAATSQPDGKVSASSENIAPPESGSELPEYLVVIDPADSLTVAA